MTENDPTLFSQKRFYGIKVNESTNLAHMLKEEHIDIAKQTEITIHLFK